MGGLDEFQSLIGILMNCNLNWPPGVQTNGAFQSLIGILMNCNNNSSKNALCGVFVSIPNRDFDELQWAKKVTWRDSTVSIPNRDFDELQCLPRRVGRRPLQYLGFNP